VPTPKMAISFGRLEDALPTINFGVAHLIYLQAKPCYNLGNHTNHEISVIMAWSWNSSSKTNKCKWIASGSHDMIALIKPQVQGSL
jgi:hypothetical protein